MPVSSMLVADSTALRGGPATAPEAAAGTRRRGDQARAAAPRAAAPRRPGGRRACPEGAGRARKGPGVPGRRGAVRRGGPGNPAKSLRLVNVAGDRIIAGGRSFTAV